MSKSYLSKEWNINGNKIELKDGYILINKEVIEFPEYYIKSYIGKGDNGIILEVEEIITNEIRALKIWLPNNKKRKSNNSRGREEIKKLSKLNHQNIVKYFHATVIKNYNCCIIEKINGITLREYLNTRHPQLDERYYILQTILETLRYSQEKGIYHGDLHLDNILIDFNKKVKILDYGTSIFSGKSSLKRDSKLLYESTIKIIGKEFDNKIMLLEINEIAKLSPHIVRIICKAVSKISVLLNFASYGLVDSIIEDISIIVILVPFFNLKYILNKIVSYKAEMSKVEIARYFMQCLLKESSYAVDTYTMYIEGSELKEDMNSIYKFYKELKNRFINNISKKVSEENIYPHSYPGYSSYQKETFNRELYYQYQNEY